MITTLTVNPAIDLTLEVSGLVVEDVNRVQTYHEDIGGKGINVSKVLMELGLDRAGVLLNTVAVLGGARSERFTRIAQTCKLPIEPVMITGETRINITVYDRACQKTTKLNQMGPEIGITQARLLWNKCLGFARQSRYFVVAGSPLPGLGSAWYGKLIHTVSQNRDNLRTVLDSDGENLKKALSSKPWLIKPNRFESERALGRKLNTEASLWWAARKLRSLGAENVILSLGGAGAIFSGLQGEYRGFSIPIRTQSTIGAGDSLLAGFLWKIVQGGRPPDALRLGLACGTHTAMTGAAKLCFKKDVRALLPKMKVEKRRL